MNIVGTPYRDVQTFGRESFPARTEGRTTRRGRPMQAPRVVQPRLPITMPKQW